MTDGADAAYDAARSLYGAGRVLSALAHLTTAICDLGQLAVDNVHQEL